MGDENNVTVEEIREEATEIVENDEQENSCGLKQAVGVAAIASCMIGAGYGLYRLGKVVVGKTKQAIEDHKERKQVEFEEEETYFDEIADETFSDKKN